MGGLITPNPDSLSSKPNKKMCSITGNLWLGSMTAFLTQDLSQNRAAATGGASARGSPGAGTSPSWNHGYKLDQRKAIPAQPKALHPCFGNGTLDFLWSRLAKGKLWGRRHARNFPLILGIIFLLFCPKRAGVATGSLVSCLVIGADVADANCSHGFYHQPSPPEVTST